MLDKRGHCPSSLDAGLTEKGRKARLSNSVFGALLALVASPKAKSFHSCTLWANYDMEDFLGLVEEFLKGNIPTSGGFSGPLTQLELTYSTGSNGS